MDSNGKIILSQIPIEELIKQVRHVFQEEIQAIRTEGSQPPNKLITEKELCSRLQITAPTAFKWRKRGTIPFVPVGSAIRYDFQKVLTALEKNNGNTKKK